VSCKKPGREPSPQAIHVAYFVIDGRICGAKLTILDPNAIAANYWNVLCQSRSAWAWEMEPRPWTGKF